MDRIAPLTLAEKWDNVSLVLIHSNLNCPQGPALGEALARTFEYCTVYR
jgi:hypothetical protein